MGPVTSSLADAEQRLLEVVFERPSLAERLSKTIATRRNLTLAAAAGLVWLIANHALDLDPFPFRWLQRVLIGSSLALATLAARAHGARQARFERLMDAHRAVEEAARWATTSRTLQILSRSHQQLDN